MNLLIICIFILNILLILQVIYYFKEFKSNSKKIKKLVLFIVFGFMLLPFQSNAKGTMIIRNGSVIEQCSSCTSLSPTSEAFITNYRFILDSMSFTANNTYTFTLAYSNTTLGGLSDVTDCGLNINGAYVTPQSRNSYRTWYSQSGNLFDSRFQTQIVYSPSSSLTSVPVFIQCDMSPALQLKELMWAESHDDSGDNVTIAIQDQTNQIIIQNDYNANQNNANRDSNTNKIIQNISNFVSTVSSGFNSVVGGISSGVNGIVSGISSAISSGISTISTGIGNVINKIGEFIGVVNSCSIVNNNNIVDRNKGLDSFGNLFDYSSYGVTGFIDIQNATIEQTLLQTGSNSYYCFYNQNNELISCNSSLTHGLGDVYIPNNAKFAKFTISINADVPNFNVCKKRPTIFSKISDLLNGFLSFVSNFFNNILGNVWENININVADNTPISDLLTLPINLLNNINSSLSAPPTRSGSGGGVHDCRSYTIPFDFTGGNNTLTFPCLDMERYLGSDIWSWLDIILTGFMIFQIALLVIHFFESWTTFKDTFDELYQPSHGAYVPRHSGGDRGLFD